MTDPARYIAETLEPRGKGSFWYAMNQGPVDFQDLNTLFRLLAEPKVVEALDRGFRRDGCMMSYRLDVTYAFDLFTRSAHQHDPACFVKNVLEAVARALGMKEPASALPSTARRRDGAANALRD